MELLGIVVMSIASYKDMYPILYCFLKMKGMPRFQCAKPQGIAKT
jgi:hypothetical protein